LTWPPSLALAESPWDDDWLRNHVLTAAETAGERLWLMPLFEDYETQIKSDVALIKNSGGRLGGACTAAAFLKTFAEETPWAHLDIAFTGHREKDKPDLARGATGFGIRTLVELVERWR
jgi:leucyl aminopeptidase